MEQHLTPAAGVWEWESQSRAGSEFNLRKRAQADVGEDHGHDKEGQLDEDHRRVKQVRKDWVSVPLIDMETEENSGKECRCDCPEANNQSSNRFLHSIGEVCAKLLKTEDAAEIDEDHRRVKQVRKDWVSVPLIDMETEENSGKECRRDCPEANNQSSNRFLHSIVEVCAKLLQTEDAAEIDDNTLDKLHVMVTGAKGIVNVVEHMVQSLQESQVQRRKEKAEIKATAAAEQDKLRNEITKLRQKNRTLMDSKLGIQRERDKLRTACTQMLGRSRNVSRLQEQREKAEAVVASLTTELASLTTELANEQDKSLCQICFTAPRDAIVFPCMHSQYCNECLQKHQQRNSECPTCRGKINGVLRSNLCTS